MAAVALGRRGQRPINAALLGAAAFAAAFFGLRGVGHPWLAGSVAIVAGVLGLAFGAIAEAWGTAALMAGLFGAAAGGIVAAFKLTWPPFAVMVGSIGLFFGITRQRKLEVILPPLFAAFFIALGISIGWAPHRRGAVLPWLLDVRWVVVLAVVLAAGFLVLAVYRERVREARLAARTREMDDEELEKAIARRRPEYEKAAQAAEAEQAGQDVPDPARET